ncbi:mediator-associated protein 2 [Sesamum indicum]|uniref:Mediator-associated protein 2 n=1 Tax=Sesamum indicum TaxID=4182 RepID=A0A6I9T3G5_SESIN|nr:mediator-associated protein 2 [Sesamum indicum]XP_020548194.1 mediator-associated protein 2 [Sesamum indicum]XP_020548195.1 mediator-associated protein 2 [Sesamum indicum]XP_020548196.1 mediator-associated protein 2 [Sesamum indicum]
MGCSVSLNLHGDGQIGTFEGSSGKSYEVVSFKPQGPEAAVFFSSASEAKIAGKISRRISLIHYPDPSELQIRNNLNLIQSQRSSTAASTMSGHRLATPSCNTKPRNSQAVSGYSTPSSRMKSSVSGYLKSSKPRKRRNVDEQQIRYTDHSAQGSGKGNSAITSTGSLEHSQERKSKKKKKYEN